MVTPRGVPSVSLTTNSGDGDGDGAKATPTRSLPVGMSSFMSFIPIPPSWNDGRERMQ